MGCGPRSRGDRSRNCQTPKLAAGPFGLVCGVTIRSLWLHVHESLALPQKANALGLITYSLYLFTLLMAALAVAAAGAFPARAKDLN
jgi:hypothetical protein